MTSTDMAGRRLGRVGAGLLALLVLVAVCAPLLAPYDPSARVTAPFASPSLSHPLGANDVGQDLLSGLLHGGRVSLAVGILAAVLATTLGAVVGLVAGTSGRAVDAVMMRLVDMVLALPLVPLTIVVGVFMGPGLATLVLVIAGVTWASTARELRSQVLSLRERDDVRAARMMGAGHWHVGRRYLLPALALVLVPQLVLAAKLSILLEAALSFLGLGDPGVPSWGSILSAAHERSAFLTGAWVWWVLPAGLCIAAAVLSFALIGYGLEERSRPGVAAASKRPAPSRRMRPPPGASSLSPPADAVVAVVDATVDYGDGATAVRAVDGVSLHVSAGEAVGLIGESGSGKSTLVTTALGLLRPPARLVEGDVWVAGRHLAELSGVELRGLHGDQVALVPQDAMSALNPVMRVGDQIAEAIRVHHAVSKAAVRERVHTLLEQVEVGGSRARAWPHELSGGMRQRAVLAMALANEPRLLVADEATNGLDVVVAAELVRLLARLREELDVALLVVSHDLPLVTRLTERLLVMQQGQVVEAGSTERLRSSPSHPYTRRLLEASSLPELASPAGPGAGM